MDGGNNRDPMSVNLSNVFSPRMSNTHMGERVYDVDFTEYGNPLVETDENRTFIDKDEIEEVYTLKRRRDSLH